MSQTNDKYWAIMSMHDHDDVWLDFMHVNFTFVYQFLPMDSESDL